MIRKCIKCGAKYTQDFSFCPKCGGALEIDPDWLDEKEKEKKEEARRQKEYEEKQRKQKELENELDRLFKIIPSEFVVDGMLFDTGYSYSYDSLFNKIARDLEISKEEALKKLNDLADMLSNKKTFNISAYKDDLAKDERRCIELINSKRRNDIPLEMHYFVRGGRYKVTSKYKDYEFISGTKEEKSCSWMEYSYKIKGYIIFTDEVYEFDGSISNRCNKIIGYSSNGEALKKYFKLKKVMCSLIRYLDNYFEYRRLMEVVDKNAPELKAKRLPDEKRRSGPLDLYFYPGRGYDVNG